MYIFLTNEKFQFHAEITGVISIFQLAMLGTGAQTQNILELLYHSVFLLKCTVYGWAWTQLEEQSPDQYGGI